MGATNGKGASYPQYPSGSYSGDNRHLASAPPDYGDGSSVRNYSNDASGIGLAIDLTTGSPSLPFTGDNIGPVLDLSTGEIGIGMKL